MTAKVIDGRAVARRIEAEIASEVRRFKDKYGFSPALGAVLAGDDPASNMYVSMKRRACERVGIDSMAHFLSADSTQEEVDAIVRQLNEDPKIHGILIQLPLPPQINEERTLSLVSLAKDVDGFHPVNIGQLAMKGRQPTFTPATPTGCMVLLEEAGAHLEGAQAVVVGRSNIVGLPMALMLMKANATVTVCHSRTRHLPDLVRSADVVIAAIGRPNFIHGTWLKPGAVVIDVGTNRVEDSTNPHGYRWVGDVDFSSALEVAGAITKVPGGVGPMTIAMLLRNTMKAAWQIVGA